MSTPADHGYTKCVLCGTERPTAMTPTHPAAFREDGSGMRWCLDTVGCARWAKARAESVTGTPLNERGGGASAIPAPSEGLDRSPYVAHAGSPTGLDENGDATK